MQIAFDAKRLFHNFTGLGNYSRTLVQNLVHFHPEITAHLYASKLKKHPETNYFLDHTRISTHTSNSKINSHWRSFGIKKDLRQDGVQLYHGLSHEIPIGIQKTGIPSVVSIHDLIFKHYPDQFPLLDRKIYDWKFRYACNHADMIIAISESTKRDIIKFYNIPSNKIQVIYQTCGEQFKQDYSENIKQEGLQKYDLPQEFMLYVGSIIPRKNLLQIIEALAKMPSSLQLPLVVIGNGKAYKKQVLKAVKHHHLEKLVFFPKVDYQVLPLLYQQAKLFLYPSVYEGFGIPIIEALYSKTPVITCPNSSLPEAGGEGAYYVALDNPEQLRLGIEKVLTDSALYNQLQRKGQAHLAKFDRENLSNQLLDVYQNLIAR